MINLRRATLADLSTLRRWDEAPHVLASDPNDNWNWQVELARTPAWREQLIAELNGRAIGFVQIIDPLQEDTHYWGDCAPNLRAVDIWIGEADCLGRGYGTRIMQQVLPRCFADARVTTVLIDPLADNTRAQHFYQRLGFTPVAPRRFGLDGCLVMQMTRAQWQQHCITR